MKLPTSVGYLKNQESSRKTSTSALLNMPKPLTVDHKKQKNSSRDGNTRSPYLPSEKPVCRSRSKLGLDKEQWSGSKLGKQHIKVVYCHPAYLTYMQSTSYKMLDWINYKLESRLPGEISWKTP